VLSVEMYGTVVLLVLSSARARDVGREMSASFAFFAFDLFSTALFELQLLLSPYARNSMIKDPARHSGEKDRKMKKRLGLA
jgi:hypothetical protein